jgi:hypothetical protein
MPPRDAGPVRQPRKNETAKLVRAAFPNLARNSMTPERRLHLEEDSRIRMPKAGTRAATRGKIRVLPFVRTSMCSVWRSGMGRYRDVLAVSRHRDFADPRVSPLRNWCTCRPDVVVMAYAFGSRGKWLSAVPRLYQALGLRVPVNRVVLHDPPFPRPSSPSVWRSRLSCRARSGAPVRRSIPHPPARS